MTITVGDQLPQATFMTMSRDGPQPVSSDDVFKGKTVALFAVPGAFTPTCSAKHLPGFKEKAGEFRGKGVDAIACVSVNDAFVMGAWGREQKAEGKVRMMADGSAEFSKACGLTLDLTARGMGVRSDRYAMLVEDGVVKSVSREAPGKFEVSSAQAILEAM